MTRATAVLVTADDRRLAEVLYAALYEAGRRETTVAIIARAARYCPTRDIPVVTTTTRDLLGALQGSARPVHETGRPIDADKYLNDQADQAEYEKGIEL